MKSRNAVVLVVLAVTVVGGGIAATVGSASAHYLWPGPSPATTTPQAAPVPGQDGGQAQDPQAQNPQAQNPQTGQAANQSNGPAKADFTDIRSAQPNVRAPRAGRNASAGTFTTRCGRNENGHRNPDNFIVTPGVSNGAHHVHDYVGNLSTDAFSTDASLQAADTTCAHGDKSAYFWPVLRVRTATDQPDPDGNVGGILTPASVRLQFRGNPRGPVTAMPSFLRVITGDAKSFTNGTTNARAQWTCTGFENRRLADKYPLCPAGSGIVRILDFPSCWDGRNTDSPNHRAHITFPDAGGACPSGFKAVPQLRMTLKYRPTGSAVFALDSFPEQLHKPVTDHADFTNVMPRRLMNSVVSCINRDRNCS